MSASTESEVSPGRFRGQPASDPIAQFRSLVIDHSTAERRLRLGAKLPYPHALLFALSVAAEGDIELGGIAADTLHRMRALWDHVEGGFYRYADAADWSGPGSGKTLEDNAALLHVYVEAALRLRDGEWLDQAAAIVRWVRGGMVDDVRGGFFNAASADATDKTMYVDKNAMMTGAFIRAAALFDDIWLRDFALKSLEAVVVPSYTPGAGVAHVTTVNVNGGHVVRGLLTDQIHFASALIWAHPPPDGCHTRCWPPRWFSLRSARCGMSRAEGFRDRASADDPVVPSSSTAMPLVCWNGSACSRVTQPIRTAPRDSALSRGRVSRARSLRRTVRPCRARDCRSASARGARTEPCRLAVGVS